MTEGPALMQTATSQCFSVKLIGGVGIKILKLALTLSLPTKKVKVCQPQVILPSSRQ